MRLRLASFWLLLLLPLAPRAQDTSWRPILYAVEDAPGRLYLLGSIHRLPEPLGPWPAPVKAAYAASSLVFFETLGPDEPDAPSVSGGSFSGLDPEGRPLHARLSETARARLETGLKQLGLNPGATALPVEPWALALVVMGVQEDGGMWPGVDDLFMARARKDRKPMRGLETARDALAAFRDAPFEEQVTYLLGLVSSGPEGAGYGALYGAWRRGDEAALQALVTAEFGHTPEFGEALLGARNRRWLPLLEEVLHTPGQTAFVVVGAAHLLGEDSVVALLRQAGYRVARR